ncbi:scopoletin glucosyltransferase-like [Phoenix dactylifera]|uniref:Glycosyltransferase n=1 Tax=Phoenix dactylifera TaxID=42345 RepID=A0A8B7CEV1_PHODC|nr:scopoletin glucosyltransferase-like [Phoenix dactylifera]
MGSEAAPHQLRMFFFPYMAAGHLIPMLDMAKLFACRGVASTIITTPSNTALVTSAIQRANSNSISLLCLPLPPPADTGLPDGWDASASIGRLDFQSVHHAIALLRGPLHHLLAGHQPDCLISDMFLPWTADIAHELGIPRLIFHGMGFFSLCVLHLLERYRPQDNVSSNDEPFIVPDLPHPIEMTRSQLPTPLKTNTDFNRLLERMHEAEAQSYGVVVNSCYEMELHYAEHYTKIIGKKAWCVGPVSLCNGSTTYDKVERASADHHGGCLAWLDSKKPGSVLYVCFGSLTQFTTSQLREIARGLEASGRAFIWVVRADGAEGVEWLSEEFEERSEGRGMIIRGWAPQILILNHEAVGGFLTHCGWNSVLEGVSAGVPMVTWPIFADQSFNEKLVVDVLEIGVRVGARIAGEGEEVVVKSEKIERAVDWVMGSGEEADRRRTRARSLGEVARRAVEDEGSSFKDMSRLIEELMLAPKRVRE